MLLETYRNVLVDQALDLSGTDVPPIDVIRICRDWGINIVRYDLPARRAVLVRTRTGHEIRLSSRCESQGRLSPLERFQIAHELGHLLLATKFAAAPVGKSEYWQHEQLCDYFASLLLLPSSAIRSKLTTRQRKPEEQLITVSELCRLAGVPWFTAAKRVAELDPRLQFLMFKPAVSKNGDHLYRVAASTLPGQREIHRQFPLNAVLGRHIQSAKKGVPIAIPPVALRCFPSLRWSEAAAAIRSTWEAVYMVSETSGGEIGSGGAVPYPW